MCKLDSGKLLYTTGSSAGCSVMTQRSGMGCGVGGRSKRKGKYVYMWLIDFGVQQKHNTVKHYILVKKNKTKL